jgi:hypothetical protein
MKKLLLPFYSFLCSYCFAQQEKTTQISLQGFGNERPFKTYTGRVIVNKEYEKIRLDAFASRDSQTHVSGVISFLVKKSWGTFSPQIGWWNTSPTLGGSFSSNFHFPLDLDFFLVKQILEKPLFFQGKIGVRFNEYLHVGVYTQRFRQTGEGGPVIWYYLSHKEDGRYFKVALGYLFGMRIPQQTSWNQANTIFYNGQYARPYLEITTLF